MPFWRLHYHVIWSTSKREPWLHGDAASAVEAAVRRKITDLHCITHGIYVMPDHVHLAVSIPPKVSLSDAIGQFKGASSRLVRARFQELADEEFRWQGEYGVLAFGEKALPEVVAYIRDQERRHADGRLWSLLETDSPPDADSHWH